MSFQIYNTFSPNIAVSGEFETSQSFSARAGIADEPAFEAGQGLEFVTNEETNALTLRLEPAGVTLEDLAVPTNADGSPLNEDDQGKIQLYKPDSGKWVYSELVTDVGGGISNVVSATPSQISATPSNDGGAVITIALEENSINEDFLSGGAVTSNKIQDLAVYSAKLGDKSVETAKIDDAAVTEDKIADGAVTTDKIDDESVAPVKLMPPTVKTSSFASLLTYASNAWSSKRFKWSWNPLGGKLTQNEVDADGNTISGGLTLADLTMNTFENESSDSNAIKISGLNGDASTTYHPDIERTALYVNSGTSTFSGKTLPATLTVENTFVDTSGGEDGGNLAAGLDLSTSPMKFSNVKYFFPVKEQVSSTRTDLFMGKVLRVTQVKFDKDTTTGNYIPNLYFDLED
ncbi:MAG: hypothetical protein ACYSSM_01720 [Planctomycetota bacterium]|jgi:hypothetical protein